MKKRTIKNIEYFANLTIDILKFAKKPLKQELLVLEINRLSICGMINDRSLRYIVNHIRCESLAPLVAHDEGYFITHNKELLQRSINRMRASIQTQLDAINGVEKFLN